MTREIYVHMLPDLFQPEGLRETTAVVLDVLRASTTITHALSAGAKAVIPTGDVDEARQIAANLSPGEAVLGGERDGLLIDGFDLDNSPLKYTEETVSGKTVVFTTTNGTRALLRCREAGRIVIGSFVNLNELVRSLAEGGHPVHIVCAGTKGEITAEDVLCAGAIVAGLSTILGSSIRLHDQARIAMDFFAANIKRDNSLLEVMRESIGGRNLHKLGMDADIERAAVRDMFDIVPCFDPETGRIEIEESINL